MATKLSDLQVGGIGLATLATGIVLGVIGGSLSVEQNIDFRPNGNSTGAVIQVNGTTQFQVFTTACSATGGLAKYPTCIVRSPYTTTGALIGAVMECGNTNRVFSMSGGFVKTTGAAVASAFAPFLNKQIATGSLAPMINSGAYLNWNPADLLKVQTVSTNGSPANCNIRLTTYDRTGI